MIYVLVALVFFTTSCSTQKKVEPDDEFSVNAGDDSSKDISAGATDELSLDAIDGPTTQSSASTTDDLNLENELNNLDKPTAEPVVEPPAQIPVVQETSPANPVEEIQSAETINVQEVVEDKPVTINNVAYQANKNGGAVIITADNPPKYTTRLNSTTNQFVIEIQNSSIPKKLKRTLNTKDMASSIGSVDIYQNKGSTTSRFVVQLRAGAAEPVIQAEGNSLLVIGSAVAGTGAQAQESPIDKVSADGTVSATKEDLSNSSIDGKSLLPHEEIEDLSKDGIMSSDNLEEFLISNNKFYGKKISIETSRMDVKEVLKFLAEESGVNLIIDDGVTGAVSLKLRNVPWDQALILLLKTKKLGFKRQGTILRIAKMADIRKDEEEAIKLKEQRTKAQPSPIIVKRFFIGYADIEQLEKKITQYLNAMDDVVESASAASGDRTGPQRGPAAKSTVTGKVIGDKRTNSIIITDTEENMQKIEQLIMALDTQPQQVLIEGKVVEAKESFTRGLGVQWASNPGAAGTTNRSQISITPALDAGLAVFNSSFTWGQLDILGSLTARLQIGEREDKVRVLSSPRIAVLSSESASISQTSGLLVNSVSTTGGTTTTSTTIVPVGVNLSVTPVVSNEGTITLNMDIKRSFLPQVDSKAPDERSARTKVIVKSGQTAVIGGIFESETREGNSGAPGLQDVPILGRLFKTTQDAKSKNELMIFVTPTILKPVAGGEKRDNSF